MPSPRPATRTPIRRDPRPWMLCLLASLTLAGAPASAAPITLSWSGVIDVVNDPNGVLDPAVTLGAAFTAELVFDPDTAVVSDTRTTSTVYATSPAPEFSVSIGGTTFTRTWDGIVIGNDDSGQNDFWGSLIEIDPFPATYLTIEYQDATSTTLSDTDFFVPSDSDFSGWTEVAIGIFYRGADDAEAFGTVFAVPEPGTAALLLLGLALLPRRRR
ncbi:MAG: PEP-CTERM sorting domain-containing protein [Myxococcota bacterium]